MKINLSKIVAGLVLAYVSSFASAAIVTNGDFENGLSGWTCANADVCTVSGGGNPGFAMYGYANNGYSSLSQSIGTVAGGIYKLTFDSRSSSTVNEIGYSFTGFSGVTWVAATPGFTQSTGMFTAMAANTNLQFFLATDSGTGTYMVDNVSVVQSGSAVPEPGSLALLGLALAGFAASRRKRQA